MSPSRTARLEALFEPPFAHRGLHGGEIIENSRAAFRAAIEAGHGIELDVQATGDGEAIVFHDYELARLTDGVGELAEMSAAELGAIALRGETEGLPTLAEILALIDGRAPLLIEVKSPGRRVGTLSGAVARALDSYIGPVAVMSFNPGVPRWFAHHRPDVLRGLVVTEDGKPERARLKRRLSLWWSKADFLAYDIRDLPSGFAESAQRRGLRVTTWTVRTMTERARAAEHADQIIYEVAPR